MSIVGPRPERPEIAVEYEKEMPEFRLRLQATRDWSLPDTVYLNPDKMPEQLETEAEKTAVS